MQHIETSLNNIKHVQHMHPLKNSYYEDNMAGPSVFSLMIQL